MAEADIAPAYRTLCSHYSRGCSLLAACCGKVYPCRVCHDEAEDHKMDRKQVETVKCRNCNELQEVTNRCCKCSIVFGESYFCEQCRLFDDQDKKQYHCDECTICRVGGRENYFHCSKCNLCWVKSLRNSHKCKANATYTSCPVCMEEIHNARDGAILLPCGHYLHHSCYAGLLENGLYKCPLCNTSMIDMKQHWQKMDEERKEWSMPRRYRNFFVQVLCQDCHETTSTQFHVIGLKCISCGSYNTSRSGNEEIPAESAEEEEEDEEEESDDGVYNEDDRVRLALLRQRLGAIISQWEQPGEGERNDGDDNRNNRNRQQQQQNMFHSFVHQLQLFQGMLDDFSGRYNNSESSSEESDFEDDSNQSSSNSERSEEEDDEHDRNDDEESDIAIEDSNSDDDPDADDEDDSSNPSSPSYSYFSQPHPINLNDIYDSPDSESDGEEDGDSSWETEEEEEVIGEVGVIITDDNIHNAQRHINDITRLSGSLGSVTIECHTDTEDSENDGLPIIPPPCWDNGGSGNVAAVASVVFPFEAANASISALQFMQSAAHDYGSSSEDDSNVNCNVQ